MLIVETEWATPVTTPVALETVATAVLDDCHVARLVTSCVVPSDIFAVAVNCDVAPTAGVDPVTLTDETVADGACLSGELLVSHWEWGPNAAALT